MNTKQYAGYFCSRPLVVVLYHEYQHANGSFGADPTTPAGMCQEIELQHQVAQKHCDFIEAICQETPGSDVSPLCTLYADNQDCFNNGCTGDGAEAESNELGCAGGYPGDIPDCPACDSDNQCSD